MDYSDRFENFWTKYGAEEQIRQKGSKRKAFESWQKITKSWCKDEGIDPDEVAFSQAVARGYDALMMNRKAARNTKEFVATLPHCTTFLNQYRFEEEFQQSTGELKRAAQGARACACGSTLVIGRSYDGGWTCRACDLGEHLAGNTHSSPHGDRYAP